MASFSIMADVPNPVFDSNGNPFSGAVLKAYLPGTTTSTSIAIDEDGASPQASITYNAAGKLEVSGNEILPYIDIKHKWGIFANATDAAANTPFYMGSFDDVPKPITETGISTQIINDLSQAYTFKTAELMKSSLIVFPVGKKIFWQGYYVESDGGSNWGVVKTGAHTEDGGEIFTLDNGDYVQANIKINVHAQKFGVKIGVFAANDTQLQKALDLSFTNKFPVKFGAGTFNFATQKSYGGQGLYGSGRISTFLITSYTGTFLKNTFKEHSNPIKNIHIGGPGAGVAGSVGYGSDGVLIGFVRTKIKNVQFDDFETALELEQSLSVDFSQVYVIRCVKGFFFIGGGAGWNNSWWNNGVVFNSCKISDCSEVGIDFVGAGLSFTGTSVLEDNGGGIRITRDAGNTKINTLSNLYFEFNADFDIELKDTNVVLGTSIHQAGGGGTSPLICISADNSTINWIGTPQYLDGGGVKRTDFINSTKVTAMFTDFESNRDNTDSTSEVFYIPNRIADKRLTQTLTDLDTSPITLAAPIGTSTRYTNHVIEWIIEAPNGDYTSFSTFGKKSSGSFRTGGVSGGAVYVSDNTFTVTIGGFTYTFKTIGGSGAMTLETNILATGDTILITRVVDSRADPLY